MKTSKNKDLGSKNKTKAIRKVTLIELAKSIAISHLWLSCSIGEEKEVADEV